MTYSIGDFVAFAKEKKRACILETICESCRRTDHIGYARIGDKIFLYCNKCNIPLRVVTNTAILEGLVIDIINPDSICKKPDKQLSNKASRKRRKKSDRIDPNFKSRGYHGQCRRYYHIPTKYTAASCSRPDRYTGNYLVVTPDEKFSTERLPDDFSYKEYLRSSLWETIRLRIIKRDKVCQICGKNRSFNVHHKSYGKDVLMGHNDDQLILLCETCHQTIHEKRDLKEANAKLHELVRVRLSEISIEC